MAQCSFYDLVPTDNVAITLQEVFLDVMKSPSGASDDQKITCKSPEIVSLIGINSTNPDVPSGEVSLNFMAHVFLSPLFSLPIFLL